jgi:hypothetical protein
MPTLIAVGFAAGTDRPFLWTCSDCGAAFSAPRIGYGLEELRKVNADFQTHCIAKHKGAFIEGLGAIRNQSSGFLSRPIAEKPDTGS